MWAGNQATPSIPVTKMDNPKVELRASPLGGTGVFAKELIPAGELIAEFDGAIYPFDYAGWTPDLLNHAVQFERFRFRDSNGIARYVNHSCEPNCGIKGLFQIVTMRPIAAGEELAYDYEMIEDSDWWRMQCQCGSPSCRKVIGAYRNLPSEVRARYRGFISEWLIHSEEESVAACA
ncbi:MAG: SET domain-containing protein-lysine N-methyltransferase [Verrucomicrobiales bacterium]|nr:SET domain-containing protein-lysine N-methyltransferase [Verrucomicrobiales bacterium]